MSLTTIIDMDYKNLHTSILKSIPFDDSQTTSHNTLDDTIASDQITDTNSSRITQLPNPNLSYQNITLNELILEEEKQHDIIKILTGNKDLTMILIGLLFLIIALGVLSYLTFITWNEIQYIKTRIPKNF
jgi:hypothetical protein